MEETNETKCDTKLPAPPPTVPMSTTGVFAEHLLNTVPAAQIARLLFTRDVAKELLMKRLHTDPTGILQALATDPVSEVEMASVAPNAPKAKRGRPAGSKNKSKVQVQAKGNGKSNGEASAAPVKRARSSAADTEALQESVCAFLKKHPGSSRKAICDAVKFPSFSVYMRVMGKLQYSKRIKGKGDKALRTYSFVK